MQIKFKKASIEKYKSIRSPVNINGFSKFNILVGPNNAGKTNVLDALELIFNPKKESLHRKEAKIDIVLEVEGEEKLFNYSQKKIRPSLSKKSRLIRINDSISIKKIATEELQRFKDQYESDYRKLSSTIEEYFQDIQMSEDLFKANIKTKDGKKSLKRMGDGFKRLFVILFYIYHPEYDIILIDEPELHLHPSVIKKFLKILNKEEVDTQVLMTTHHPTMVQAKFLDKTWRIARDDSHSTSIYKFNEKSSLDIDRFVQEINDDNSAMLFADKVLLVEGVSDSILMRELIDKFYTGREDIKVVYSGGVGDIDLYEKVCEIFNIPYKVMIDGDMLEMYWQKKFGKKKSPRKEVKRDLLEKENIFVLKGDLEDNYPKKYQKRDTKPLNALFAGNKINESDFSNMSELKRVIENL